MKNMRLFFITLAFFLILGKIYSQVTDFRLLAQSGSAPTAKFGPAKKQKPYN